MGRRESCPRGRSAQSGRRDAGHRRRPVMAHVGARNQRPALDRGPRHRGRPESGKDKDVAEFLRKGMGSQLRKPDRDLLRVPVRRHDVPHRRRVRGEGPSGPPQRTPPLAITGDEILTSSRSPSISRSKFVVRITRTAAHATSDAIALCAVGCLAPSSGGPRAARSNRRAALDRPPSWPGGNQHVGVAECSPAPVHTRRTVRRLPCVAESQQKRRPKICEPLRGRRVTFLFKVVRSAAVG